MPIKLRMSPDEPFDVAVFDSDDDSVIVVDLGECPENGLTYFLFCTLQPKPMGIPATMEFMFWIADYDPHTQKMDKIANGADTKHLLVGNDRTFVLFLVCKAMEQLVGKYQPQSICIMANRPSLPAKALRKYHMIGKTLETVGYKFWRLDPYADHEAWKAERLAND